jgi:uncharacterized membrane protein
MLLLILGLLLWSLAHLFRRLAPDARARLGEGPGKGLVALGILAGLVLMVVGYRAAPTILLYTTPAWTIHLNNLLMLVAVFFLGISGAKGRLAARFRHPMLASVKIWALAHLLVNGDLASILLFGGLLAWAVVEVIVINKSTGWTPPAPGPVANDVKLGVGALLIYAAIAGIHWWLGVWPLPGAAPGLG